MQIAHEGSDASTAPRLPLRIARVGRCAGAGLDLVKADRRWAVAPVRPGIAHEIQVDSVDVVVAREVHEHAVQVDLDLGHARIEISGGRTVGRSVAPLVAVLDVDLARLPCEEGVDPGMDLDARHRAVGELDQERKRVEAARAGDVARAWLIRVVEVRVARLANLDEQRVEVASSRVGDELPHLLLRFDPVMECIDPERAVLGRIERDRRRGWRRRGGERGEPAQEGRGRASHHATANTTWLRPVVSITPGCSRFSVAVASSTNAWRISGPVWSSRAAQSHQLVHNATNCSADSHVTFSSTTSTRADAKPAASVASARAAASPTTARVACWSIAFGPGRSSRSITLSRRSKTDRINGVTGTLAANRAPGRTTRRASPRARSRCGANCRPWPHRAASNVLSGNRSSSTSIISKVALAMPAACALSIIPGARSTPTTSPSGSMSEATRRVRLPGPHARSITRMPGRASSRSITRCRPRASPRAMSWSSRRSYSAAWRLKMPGNSSFDFTAPAVPTPSPTTPRRAGFRRWCARPPGCLPAGR